MDLGRPTTTTEARALISMIQYNRDMCPRRSHILGPLIEAVCSHKVRKIIWNDFLEEHFN